jgi:hypothetical protein
MNRLPDWEQRLYAYLAEVRATPYHPVEHNCAHFVLGAVEAITGEDPAAKIGITLPDTEIGVARLLVENGGMRGIAECYFGAEASPPLLGRRGDIGITNGMEGEVLGVFDTDGLICLTPDGIWRFNMRECLGSWRLG